MKFLFTTFLFFLILPQNGKACDDSLLYWDINVKLKWSQMKGRVPDKSDLAATVRTGIKVLQNDKKIPFYEVYAVVFIYDSWAMDTLTPLSSLLLEHEQIHFDIAELYARKIRRKFESLRRRRIKKLEVYAKELKIILAEYTLYQREYDKKTKHGSLIGKQIEWNEKISKQLKKHSGYAPPPPLNR